LRGENKPGKNAGTAKENETTILKNINHGF
jgi:hypothetical protein